MGEEGAGRGAASSRSRIPVPSAVGLTLIIGVVLALGWFLFIPVFLPKKYDANEILAIAALRSLASAEASIRGTSKIDVDLDGKGEFAFLQEFTGVVGVRVDATGLEKGLHIRPPLLSPDKWIPDARGSVSRAGYWFRVFLPSGPDAAATEGEPGKPFTAAVATDLAEKHWCAYAWPTSRTNSGARTFFVNETGDVWSCMNAIRKYSGLLPTPAWNAALPPGAGWGSSPGPDSPATDGEVWTKVR